MTLTLEHDSDGARATGVERRFLGWSEPFLARVARELADVYLAGGELRMDGAIVVVPGGRSGRRLKELLLARAEAEGVRLVPPGIVTVGSLPELLYSPELPLAGAVLAVRAWSTALRTMGAGGLRLVSPNPPAAPDLVGWTRLAAGVAALHDDVSAGGSTFAEVVDLCDEEMAFSDAERWRVLAAAQSSYARLLEGWGASDRGLARIAALQAGAVSHPGRDVWLAGVVEMPRVLGAMLRALGGAGGAVRSFVHAPPALADAFDELGCVISAVWARRPVPLADSKLVVTGRPADQADEVVRALSGLGGRYAPEEIVVAVPDAEVLPYLEQRLSSAGVPVRRATGATVSRTTAPRLLAAVADYLDGHRYDACAALARHPDVWRWIGRARHRGDGESTGFAERGGWVAALDEHFTRRLPTRLRTSSVDGGHWSARVVRDLLRILDDRRLLGRLTGSRRISEWMPRIIDLLLEVYGERALDRNIPEERGLLDALSRIRDGAAELHRLPAAADERCEAATAIRLLLEAVGSQVLSPRADDAAVELLGWLEVHLDDSPVTVVTGLNEGMLPASVNAHAYLPNTLRTRLGLVDNDRRYARDAYQLTALVHSSKELVAIAGRRTIRGDPLRPSRLIFAVEGAALAERVKRFYGDAIPDAGEPVEPLENGGGSGFQLPPHPELAAPSPIDRLSVSRFGAVLTNPYVFALESVLGLRALDDEATELDGLGFGNLAHHVLERFGRGSAAASADREEISLSLDEILDGLIDARFGDEALPAVRFQAEQLRARLHAFAGWQAAWVEAGWRIVGVECTTPEAGVPFLVDGDPFAITGRIDRIDHNPGTGAWAIFDYKTGDAGDAPDATHRSGRGDDRLWTDLQLPLYRHILPYVVDAEGRRPFTGADPGGALLGYILLPRDTTGVGECFADWSPAELEEADEAAADVVRLLRRGRFRWDPSNAATPRDPHLAALLGLGYLESAVDADGGEDDE